MTTLENLIYLQGESHILKNTVYLAREYVGSPSVNKISIYLKAIFLHSIVQLIFLLMNFYDSVYISVAAYANN